ncbi:MAG: hypothetical protein Ta2B_13140 [Termitinemataceae bacterium]|nr:MAG: hypothetical protein Ta2B_13140 [Termitinemataceae bacterium]
MILGSTSSDIEQNMNGKVKLDVRLEDGLSYMTTNDEYSIVQMERKRKVLQLRGHNND